MLGLLFYPEDGDARFLRNVGNDPLEYKKPHPQYVVVVAPADREIFKPQK
jgi:hypothetical protein